MAALRKWTNPHGFVDGELVTTDQMNCHTDVHCDTAVRDNMEELKSRLEKLEQPEPQPKESDPISMYTVSPLLGLAAIIKRRQKLMK